MIEKINQIRAALEAATASSAQEVEALRIRFLSKKGEVASLMNDFRTVAADQKRELGQRLNELKTFATDRINSLRESVEAAGATVDELDLTRTPAPVRLGTRHPLSLVREQIIDIFRRLGFTIAEG
ncbi:MAG: phenylalanine--tRNA ligase subunit alpha, partial [Muribaculaceae bacterium]|nr:phenylalanine--tRNA ligase subunit alpha [Muribaculaceae bacterium]